MAAITFAKARDKLYTELDRLGASNVVISSNHKPDIRGVPIESKRSVGDEGIAIYFKYKGKAMAMACDSFDTAAGNMRSLGLAIEGLRQLERHGGGTMMERAFEGFVALPSAQPHWRSVFGYRTDETVTIDMVRAKYRKLAAEYHPDRGGDDTAMATLNVAHDQAQRELS